MDKKNLETRAEQYLKQHSRIEKLYATSDGFLFEKKEHATSHAQTLGDTELTELKRKIGKNPKTPQTLSENNKD